MSGGDRRPLRVIGVGNRDRGDDAVGPIICDRVASVAGSNVDTAVIEAAGIDLATYWDDDDRVVVIDATPPTGRPGRVVEIDALERPLRPTATLSTHAVDVGASIELARVLDAMPSELTVIAIEAVGFEFGAPLSTAVERRVDEIVDRITARAAGSATPP